MKKERMGPEGTSTLRAQRGSDVPAPPREGYMSRGIRARRRSPTDATTLCSLISCLYTVIGYLNEWDITQEEFEEAKFLLDTFLQDINVSRETE